MFFNIKKINYKIILLIIASCIVIILIFIYFLNLYSKKIIRQFNDEYTRKSLILNEQKINFPSYIKFEKIDQKNIPEVFEKINFLPAKFLYKNIEIREIYYNNNKKGWLITFNIIDSNKSGLINEILINAKNNNWTLLGGGKTNTFNFFEFSKDEVELKLVIDNIDKDNGIFKAFIQTIEL